MYLKKLTLQNFRCFQEVEVEFHENLTVLVGVNGSGKTSILEGAALAVGTLFLTMDTITAKSINKMDAHLNVQGHHWLQNEKRYWRGYWRI